MSNTQVKVAAGVLAVLVILGVLSFFGVNLGGSQNNQPQFGSTVNPNTEWFASGIKIGNDGYLLQSDVLTVGVGKNQTSWRNNTGQTVYVSLAPVVTAGTASSTFNVYLGTSTAATVTNVFTLTSAPMWSQGIDGLQIATGTVAGLWGDNISNHKTSYSSILQVNNGQYLVLIANTFCNADGACNTATSSARGWSTITVPFRYYYQSQ